MRCALAVQSAKPDRDFFQLATKIFMDDGNRGPDKRLGGCSLDMDVNDILR